MPDQYIHIEDHLQLMRDLDKAVIMHATWATHIQRALTCKDEKIRPGDVGEMAHKECGFGSWLGQQGKSLQDEFPNIESIEALHTELHQLANDLILAAKSDDGVTSKAYTNFMDIAMAFKIEVRNLEFSIVRKICSLDHLTGAWNRTSMTYRLNQEYERVIRNNLSCVIAIFDLDHFKQVNDSYGHVVGDYALKQVSDICHQSLRKYDALFRYGGEEFLICLPESSLIDALPLLERQRKLIAEANMSMEKHQKIHITASFGAAELNPGKSIEDAIREADQSLLIAKANGRNQVVLWPKQDESSMA